MVALGMIFGLIAFCAVNSFVGEFVIARYGTGVLPGLVAAIWAAYPFFQKAQNDSLNLLCPRLKKYPVNVQVAFSKIRRILGEASYFYGDKWYVVTADTATNSIVADLRFYEEETKMESSGRGHFHSRQVRVQRYIRLNCNLSPEGISESSIQMDFEVRVEGWNKRACDEIIAVLKQQIEEEIGPGQTTKPEVLHAAPQVPWWLIGGTSFALFFMFVDITRNLWGS
ncbi:MAG: hypothetical protein SFY67_10390 [Candidatus Melainabacteria bacterium]|nr:hypothetical protein [Candidatus Melainabacteria bacterium]